MGDELLLRELLLAPKALLQLPPAGDAGHVVGRDLVDVEPVPALGAVDERIVGVAFCLHMLDEVLGEV